MKSGFGSPPELEVVEDPAMVQNGRCTIEVLADGPALMGPSTRLVKIWPMTTVDERILRGVRQAEMQHTATHEQLTACRYNAAEAEKSPMAKERLLKASCKTRGKKERQEALFPELQKEIEGAHKKPKTGITWPDQGAEEYKEELAKRAEPLVGLRACECKHALTC